MYLENSEETRVSNLCVRIENRPMYPSSLTYKTKKSYRGGCLFPKVVCKYSPWTLPRHVTVAVLSPGRQTWCLRDDRRRWTVLVEVRWYKDE